MNDFLCNLSFRLRLLTFFMILVLPAVFLAPAKAQQKAAGSHDRLAEILLKKGILTPDDMKQIDQAATPQQAEALMARVLRDKGVLSETEYEQIAGSQPAPQPVSPAGPATVQAQTVRPPTAAQAAPPPLVPPSQANTTAKVEKPAPLDALVPIRLLPVGGVSSHYRTCLQGRRSRSDSFRIHQGDRDRG